LWEHRIYAPQSYMDTSTAQDPEEDLVDAEQTTSLTVDWYDNSGMYLE